MAHIVKVRRRRKPQRLLYRTGITSDELARLVSEVGREQVEAVLRGLGLSAGSPSIPAE
jgi:hypothetical protein